MAKTRAAPHFKWISHQLSKYAKFWAQYQVQVNSLTRLYPASSWLEQVDNYAGCMFTLGSLVAWLWQVVVILVIKQTQMTLFARKTGWQWDVGHGARGLGLGARGCSCNCGSCCRTTFFFSFFVAATTTINSTATTFAQAPLLRFNFRKSRCLW